ncbi:ComEC/Rec2 family competence protein [Candidatus Gracilibacteria bacterium]|nr:ComEC/Rec2 family competence protein [Candidatus Gracilibacteria bacterium]
MLIFIIISFILGVLTSNYNLIIIEQKEKILNNYFNNKNYEIILEIKSLNKIDENKKEYIGKLIQIEKQKINNNIGLIVNIYGDKKLEKGYIIKTNTKLYKFKNYNGFSYKNYMLSKNIYFSINSYNYKIIEKNKINIIEKSILEFRKKVLKAIYQIYPKEEAIFLGGILIGARESLPNDLKQDFNNSGLTHFIAVSGFNITILIIFITYLIQYLPNTLKIIIITISIILFTILVGYTAPVIRASLMGLIGYYILQSGRKGNLLSIILLTAIIMIIISPLSINYDVSLHLSFLAVLGIVYSQKFFEKIFYFLPNFLEIKTAFTLTLSALLFTLPIMIFNFGQVSILAPFSNIAVTWTIPLAMIFGFLSVIVYFVYPIGGIIIGYITWIFLKWDIMVVHFFGNLDWSLLKIDFGIYKNQLEITYFIIFIFLIIYFRKKETN